MPVDVEATVLANRRLSADYNVLELAAPQIAVAARPGQFVMIKPAAGTDPLLRRPFSVFERLRSDSGEIIGISILNKRVGVGTTRLLEAAPGTVVPCLGPLGRAFTEVEGGTEAWMVAGGVGLAPFVMLAESLAARRTPMTLFYGGRSRSDLYYTEWFEQRGVRLVLATEDGSFGERGLITDLLARDLARMPAPRGVMLYACGPEGMLAAVARLAASHDRPAEVSTERRMGCGMGGCYSCVVRVRDEAGRSHYVRSCLAGPVFRTCDIVWED